MALWEAPTGYYCVRQAAEKPNEAREAPTGYYGFRQAAEKPNGAPGCLRRPRALHDTSRNLPV